MGDEKKFIDAKTEQPFVDFDGNLLKVEIVDMGSDYLEVKVIDKRKLPLATSLRNSVWIVSSGNLKVVRKKIGK